MMIQTQTSQSLEDALNKQSYQMAMQNIIEKFRAELIELSKRIEVLENQQPKPKK